jgi:Flp pilus assembly protein TadD
MEICRRVLGPEHPSTLSATANLAIVFDLQGKESEAEPLFRQILEVGRRRLGPQHPFTLAVLAAMTFLYQHNGQYASAEKLAVETLAGRRQALGSQHQDTMASAADLALAYRSEGRFAEAEPLAREAVEFYRNKQPDNWRRYRAESLLGAALSGLGKYSEGEPLLIEGYQGMLARKARISLLDEHHVDQAHKWLVQLYQAWGKLDQAAEWQKR